MPLTQYRIDRDGADRLLFLIHGYTAEQHHLASYVPLVDPDERFTAIAPRGPIDMPDGDGAGWWTIDVQTFEHDWSRFVPSLEMLEDFIAKEADKAGVPLERCVVGGFSQGGFLSLALAGKAGAPRYAGVWAICCGPRRAGFRVRSLRRRWAPRALPVGHQGPGDRARRTGRGDLDTAGRELEP